MYKFSFKPSNIQGYSNKVSTIGNFVLGKIPNWINQQTKDGLRLVYESIVWLFSKIIINMVIFL